MKARNVAFALVVQTVALGGFVTPSLAFDLTGAWATNKNACPRVFTKSAASIAFASDSEMWGKGFIIEGNSIRGQTVKCTIKSRKEKGEDLHLLTSCATDIMVDQVQLSFKVTGDDTITRIFPGMDGLEIAFSRCRL